MLKITTIGAFDLCKAERAEARKRKDREAKRAKRAENSTGRPRGRPRKTVPKNASAAVREAIAVDAISERTIPAHTSIAATKPSADAVGPTPESIGLTVGAGSAGVGNHERRFRTRFPTSMRLSNEQRAYAHDAGFDPPRINLMFKMFRLYNFGQRTYSADWERVWFNWVDREVSFETERYYRERRRAYFEWRRQASKKP